MNKIDFFLLFEIILLLDSCFGLQQFPLYKHVKHLPFQENKIEERGVDIFMYGGINATFEYYAAIGFFIFILSLFFKQNFFNSYFV